jgi:AcrR family transcriptional regulator
VFFQEGYAGAAMDRITAEAGVSKATVYNHFRSKEELLLAVVDDVIVPFHAEYRAVLDHDAPFVEWLTDLAVTVARKATMPETIALTRLLMAESLRFPKFGQNSTGRSSNRRSPRASCARAMFTTSWSASSKAAPTARNGRCSMPIPIP